MIIPLLSHTNLRRMCRFLCYIVAIYMLSGCANRQKNNLPIQNNNCCKKYTILQEHILAEMKNENIPLNNIEEILDQETDGIVIARIFGNYCGTCIDSIFSTILRTFKEGNFVVFASDISSRYLKHKFGNSFRIVDINEINIPIERKQMPYLFYFDNDKVSKHMFIVDKVSLDLFNEYCNSINNRYFLGKE